MSPTARLTAAAALLLAWAAPPAAADDLADLRACLAACSDIDCDHRCEGLVYTACEARQGPAEAQTTAGMAQCMWAEHAAWDAVLNALWSEIAPRARADSTYDELLAAQRAWIVWREAECAYEHARWGQGSMRLLAAPACQSALTADRVRSLRSWTREGG